MKTIELDHTFKHLAKELTIWAYINTLKNCFYKGLIYIKFNKNKLPKEPNLLFLHKKKGKNLKAEYILKFLLQNANTMLYYLYRFIMPKSLLYNKYISGNSTLTYCYITALSKGYTNCL
ncbi:unnamed protein product [Fusarium fujikuroi]|nr:unnamed protein product [Fusarium fujikuroi]